MSKYTEINCRQLHKEELNKGWYTERLTNRVIENDEQKLISTYVWNNEFRVEYWATRDIEQDIDNEWDDVVYNYDYVVDGRYTSRLRFKREFNKRKTKLWRAFNGQ